VISSILRAGYDISGNATPNGRNQGNVVTGTFVEHGGLHTGKVRGQQTLA
jgi:hypothetical protein